MWWHGISVVLMQEGGFLSFERYQIKGKDLNKPIYKKEMLERLHAIKQWHLYLISRHLKVNIDHESLQYLLEQILY